MTKRLTMLKKLIAKVVEKRRAALRALSACLCATALAAPVHAQLVDGLNYGGEMPVGSAALGEHMQFADGSPTAMMNEQAGVYVGPGGPTSIANMPSVVEQPTAGSRHKLVSQPWAQGPFVQQQPVHDAGGYMPCPCDDGCDFTYYGNVEALYFRRERDRNFALSQFQMGPFDDSWGGRVTIGQVKDCTNGYEFVYTGPFKWDRSRFAPPPAGTYNSILSVSGLPASVIAPFNNANVHNQIQTSRLSTYEVNRRWWAWDVFSVLAGIRYVDFQDVYAFSSNSPGNGTATLVDGTRNRMVGPQIGGEVMQPLGLRTSVGFRGKAALLANFDRNTFSISTLPFTPITVNDVDIAGMFETATYAKYDITRSIRLTGGYEFWYLPGVATVRSQGLNVISNSSGTDINAKGSVFVHGATVGAQILF